MDVANPAQDRVGQVIHGKYRITKLLGQGAFGMVWLCEDMVGRKIVIKSLHQQWAQVPAVVERFRREAVATNRVQHPNICHVYDYAMDEQNVPYIAMEYLDGGTLKEALAKDKTMSLARVADIMAPVAECVAAAHAAGIVHRDLKLENVMLTRRDGVHETPIVLDFGIAKLLDSAEKLTQTGSMMGTPTYMSPEQCKGLVDIGPAADVYSLAVMTYELLVGTPPFTARSVAELAMKHVLEPPPDVTGVAPALTQTMRACLAKEPGPRPPATQLATALREAARVGGQAASVAARPQPATITKPMDPHAARTMMSTKGDQLQKQVQAQMTARPGVPVWLIATLVVILLGALGAAAALLLK